MAIDLRKESYDENGVRKPLTVCPDVESPEIYPQRKASSVPAPRTVYPDREAPEIYPQNKAESVPVGAEPSSAPHGGLLSALKEKRSFFATASVIAFIAAMFVLLFFADNEAEPQSAGSEEAFSSDEIQAVNINSLSNTSLKFLYDTEGSNSITVRTKNGNYPVSLTADESRLSIECGGIKTNTPVTLVLPQGYDGKIQVKGGDDCDITVNAGSDLDICVSSGEINASDLKAEFANFTVTEGNVDISGSKFSKLSVHIGNGNATLCDIHISNSFYTNVVQGKFDGRRIASYGTTDITATGGKLRGESKHGGKIYCEDILMRGNSKLAAHSGIKLYRADFRDIRLECYSRWNNVKVQASQPAEIYMAYCNKDTDKLKYYHDGLYELSVYDVGILEPDFEFDCDPPTAPKINNS